MADKLLEAEQILTMLAAAPQRIAASTAGLTGAQLKDTPNPGEWSANEVLAHLRACADVWGGCIAILLAQDRPVIRAVNPRTWIKDTDYLLLEFQASLQAFSEQRARLMTILQPLTTAAWARSATVVGAGKTLVRTVQLYGDWLALHERPHLKQIDRIAQVLRGQPRRK